MKLAAMAIVTAVIMTATGCGNHKMKPKAREVALTEDTFVAGGLSTTIKVPKERYSRGDYIPVYVRLTNITKAALRIPAQSDRRVSVVAYRETPLGWQRLKESPGSATTMENLWVLAPGGQKVFNISVYVGPEVPPDSYLRLVANVSGMPDVAPGVTVWILPAPGQVPDP